MFSTTQALDAIRKLRDKNPGLSSFDDITVAKAVKAKTGSVDFDDFIDSSWLLRKVGEGNLALKDLTSEYVVEPVDKAINKALGDTIAKDEDSLLGEIAGGIAESTPELALIGAGLGAGAVGSGPVGPALGVVSAALLAGARAYADTGDPLASVATTAAMAATGGVAKAGSTVVEAALPTVAKRVAPKLAEKLGEKALTRIGTGIGSYAGGTLANLPPQFVMPTDDPEDSIVDRVFKNARRLSSPREAALYFGSDLGFAGIGYAGKQAGRALAGAEAARQRGPSVFIESDMSLRSYEAASTYLTERGLAVDPLNSPAAIINTAESMKADPEFYSTDWARYELIRDKAANAPIPEMQITADDFALAKAWLDARPARAKLLSRRILAGTLALRDRGQLSRSQATMADLLTLTNLQSLDDYSRSNPIKAEQLYTSLENTNPDLLNATLGKVPESGFESAKEILASYRNGILSAEELGALHPDLVELVRSGDAFLNDLFTTEEARAISKDTRTDFSKRAEALAKYIDQQSKAYQVVARTLDLPVTDSPLRQTEADRKKAPDEAAILDQNKEFSFTERNKAGLNLFEKHFLADLQLAMAYPETRNMFDIERSMKQRSRERYMEQLQNLGQDETKSLTPLQALENAEAWLQSKQGLADMQRMSSIFEQEHKNAVKQKGLIPDAELMSKYKLMPEQVRKYKALREMPMKVAAEEVRVQRHIDELNMTKLVYLLSDKRLTHDEAGRFTSYLQQYLDQTSLLAFRGKHADTVGIASYKDFLTSLAKNFNLDVADEAISQILELSITQKRARDNILANRSEVGYLPTGRRGKYLVELVKKDALDKERKDRTADDYRTVDGDKKAEIEATVRRLQKQGWVPHGETIKQDRKRADSLYNQSDTQRLIRQQVAMYNQFLDERKKAGTLTPEVEEAVRELQAGYNPAKEAYQEALASTASQYNLRRKDIQGFQPSQFIPNILDHSKVMMSSLQKRLALAQANLELSRPIYDQVEGLRSEWQSRFNYALGADTKAINAVREFVAHYWLALSPRNLVLQSTQNVMTGLGPMLEKTGSYHDSAKAITTGMKHMQSFMGKGTTGDKILDRILKQAEKDGVTLSTELDLWVNAAALDKLDAGTLSSLSGITPGKTVLDNVRRLLRSTSAFAERQNRVWSIASMASHELAKLRKTGKTITQFDIERIYREARRYSDEVNFVGDRANRAGFIKHSSGPITHDAKLIATTMQGFAFNYMGQLYAIAKRAKANNRYKALAGAAGVLLMAGGSLGMPMSRDALQLASAVTGDDLEAKIRGGLLGDNPSEGSEAFIDALLYGIPGSLGADSSLSLGLGSVINYNAGDSQAQNVVDFFTGATGQIISKFVKAGEAAFAEGDFEKAFRNANPQATKWFTRLAEAYANNTVYNTSGVPSQPLDTKDIGALLTGFTPMSVAQQNKANYLYKRKLRRNQEQKQIEINQIAKLYATGDVKSAKEKLARLMQALGPTQDERALLQSMGKRVFTLKTGLGFPSPALSNVKAFKSVIRSYPSSPLGISSPLSLYQTELATTLALGSRAQQQAALRRMPASLRSRMLNEQLLRAGINPAFYRLAQQQSIESKERLARILQSPESVQFSEAPRLLQ